jgi:hypothetical protein
VSGPALWRELAGIACQLGDDELRVLVHIASRLRVGAGIYGPLCIATDTRAFRTREAREELEDALVYLACAWLKERAHAHGHRLELQPADRPNDSPR